MNVYFVFIVLPYILMMFIKSEKFSLWLFLFVIQILIVGMLSVTGDSVGPLEVASAYSVIIRAFVMRALYKMIHCDSHRVLYFAGRLLFWFSLVPVIYVNILIIVYAIASYVRLNYGQS